MVIPPLPNDFIQSILTNSPFGQTLLDALNGPSPTSVRINPRKKMAFDNSGLEPVPWCKEAYYLEQRPNFTLSPLFHSGTYYPQEAASMAIYDLVASLKLHEGCIVLDACAAPGGKTLAMMDALPDRCAAIANEIHPHRANILCETITKWGLDNVAVCNNDTSIFRDLNAFFDLVLIDAPCSGEGMFRKDPNARLEWSLESVHKCSERQSNVINNLISCIKPGGYLIYATCTFNQSENEARIQEILATGEFELQPWKAPSECTVGRDGLGHYFVPSRSRSEGLFIGVLKKCGTLNSNPITFPFTSNPNFTGLAFDVLANQELIRQNNRAHLRSWVLGQALSKLKIPLRFLKYGIAVAESTVKGWVPQHDLSMYASPFPQIEITKHEALLYLRGETFTIPPSPPGYYLMCYQGTNLGFIKHLGNRFNNLYPKAWRIRMHLK